MDSYIPLITNHVLSKKYRKMQEKSSYNNHVDKKLKKHILQYLDSVDDERLVNSDSIVNELRKTYSDYSRKKRSSFKLAVIKTYNAINNEKKSVAEDAKVKSEQEDTNRDTDGLPESDFSEENENYVFFEDRNSVNKSICDLYNKSTAIKRKLTPKKDEKPVESPIKQREQELESASFQVETNGVSKKKRKLVAFASEPKDDGVSNVKATKKKEVVPEQTQITFADIGGYEKCLEDVSKILRHLKHPELFVRLGAQPPRGLLLHGPPGCGKTLLAHAISGELQMPLIKVAATEIVAGVSGESEEKIRDLFGKAISSAPCILFIDEIDVITPKRESAQRLMEQRIVAQLLASMDDLNLRNATAQILVIGATNRPDALDSSLRRPGRFDREINLGIPDEKARIRIIKVLCRNLKLEAEFDFAYIGRNTPGFVGADLMALKSESVNCAVDRVLESVRTETTQKDENSVSEEQVATSLPTDNNLNCNAKTSLEYELSWLRSQPSLTEQQLLDFFVEMKDFKLGLDIVQPSAKREGFANIPDITWEDIGALSEVREELQFSILAPVRHPEKFKVLGLSSPVGILLCGPPGCGKTLLAKAVANESEVNFISVKGPELLNMYVGESERAVRQCFQRARNSAPCVIFFDELDALCPKRSDSGEGSAGARVVTQLLTEMDGMESRKDVYILGATNRPDVIDPAILRPGRFGKVLYVGLPTGEDRLDILKALTKNGTKPKFEDNICLRDVALDERCNGFTGADLSSLINEASVAALKEFIAFSKTDIEELRVGKRHFECAFKKVVLSVSPRDQQMYERMRLDFTKVRNLESP